MTKVSTTVTADDFCSYAEGTVCMSCDCTGDGIVVCRPAAARLEFVVRLVERRTAAGAGVNTRVGHVLIIFTGPWSFGTFLTEDSELFYKQKSA